MFTGSILAFIVVVFLLVLLTVALIGERITFAERQQHIVYSLALGIHCTTWAMFGTISQASHYGWSLIPTYLGMMLGMLFGFASLKKVAQICIRHNIASLADFMSYRFNHSFGLPALITVVCVIAVIPYIALQLDAIATTAEILLPASTAVSDNINWLVALSMVAFALFFGTRSKSLSPKHPGLLLLVAFTSIIKVVALTVIALWVCYGLFDGIYDLLIQAVQHPTAILSFNAPVAWYTYSVHVLLGVVSLFCLPRQFHMNFVELPQLQALNTARWILPGYLLCMSVGVLPIALAGNILLYDQAVSSDIFTLALPLYANQNGLALVAFIGGLSAATAMIIVSTLALGIMLGNNVATPLYFLFRQRSVRFSQRQHKAVALKGTTILWFRRFTVVMVLLFAYFYHINISQTMPLVNTGFIALALIAQLFPSFVLNNVIEKPPVSAPIMALLCGSIAWYILILSPSLGFIDGIALATQQETNLTTGQTLIDKQLAQGLIWALVINISVYILSYIVSGIARDPNKSQVAVSSDELNNLFIRNSELQLLCQRLLPGRDLDTLFNPLHHDDYVPHAQLSMILSLVANQVGFATAKLLFNTIADSPDTDFQKGEWIAQTQALTQAKDTAIRENVFKTKFLAAAGHDLMQPFNAAQLFATLLAEKNTDPALHQTTSGLVQSLDNAETLLTMLLDITKLESGVITPNLQPFYIDDIIAPLIAEFAIIAQQANVNLRYVPSNQMVLSDKLLLKRIVQNLLANAIRYTGLHYQTHSQSNNKVLIGVRLHEDTIALWICDTGPGIPKDKQKEIFGEFTQLNTAQNQLGLGLGLTIVEKMAKLLAHPIILDSIVGKGTRFCVTIPKISNQQRRPAASKQQAIHHKQQPQRHINSQILLIENDAQVAHAMKALFRDWGYTVTWVSARTHALQLSRSVLGNIDIVVCDYHLDWGENGIDVYLSIINQLKSKHKAILTTADRSLTIREMASEHGLLYLPKPIKPIALKHLLTR